jgi:parallel beta-helix repeat protein
MKTLAQIEPRTPISGLPFTITNGGSFYLTTNLTGIADNDGILIAASDVTLDLAGFALIGMERSARGIHVTGLRTNLAIANGVIRGWGEHGVSAGTASGARLCNLSSSHNGGKGISVGDAAIVKDCSVRNNGDRGISAGVNSIVSGCVAFQNDQGIWADVGSTIAGCAARENIGAGIGAGTGSIISGCTTHYNGTGIYVNNDCHVLQNNLHGNGQGIEVMLDNNRVDGNNITSCTWAGIAVHSHGNIIVRNTARANNPNFSLINTTNTVGEILDYSSGGTITNASPWANFSY